MDKLEELQSQPTILQQLKPKCVQCGKELVSQGWGEDVYGTYEAWVCPDRHAPCL
jgi:hypothetical protein